MTPALTMSADLMLEIAASKASVSVVPLVTELPNDGPRAGRRLVEEAERIRANADRQARVILAEAERDGQTTRGVGDALATDIYARAYGQDEEFFAFYRSLEAYGSAFGHGSDVMVIDPSSSFFDYFGSDKPVTE